MEAAALGGICGRGNITLEDDTVHFHVGVGMGNCGEQSLCVGMEGICEDILLGSEFHHTAKVHNTDLIGDVLNYGKVVGDKHVSQSQIVLQLF